MSTTSAVERVAHAVGSVRASAYTVPTDAPEADGTLAWDSTTLVLVEAGSYGQTGTGWTYAPAAAVPVVHDLLAPEVVGRDALDVQGAWKAMVRAVRNAGRPGLVGMAISAVDIALWDLAARIQDRPLAEVWDRPVRDVPVYGSGGFTSYDPGQLAAQLTAWLDLGIDQVKIKIGEKDGRRVGRDLDRVSMARDLVGPHVALLVDANGGYSTDQAVRVGSLLDDLGVVWFEEPVSSDDLAGLETVRAAVAADVTAGEYGYDLAYFERMAPTVDCLQIDVTRCGGYTEWRRIAAMADGRGLEISGHCAPYASWPVAATSPGLRHVEWFHDHARIEPLFFEGAEEPEGGCLLPPIGPGHGLNFRPRAAARFRVA
jgi:L-alanine-DL-glutamate epimerase-like enolase superfamily enzyme